MATKKNATTAEAAGKIAKKTPTKKAKPKADGVKKTKKKGDKDEKEDPMAGRWKLTMEDLAAAEQGVALVRCGSRIVLLGKLFLFSIFFFYYLKLHLVFKSASPTRSSLNV